MRAFLSLILALSCLSVFSNVSAVYAKEGKQQNYVALTFDDGPHKKYTAEILDILDKYGVKATFFVIGINARQYPSLVESELKRGHEVGNHTYYHKHGNASSEKTFENDIRLTDSVFMECFNYETSLFRPPEGFCNSVVRNVADKLDRRIVMWDVDTRDWSGRGAKEITEHVQGHVKNGDIILFHDYIVGESHTAEALSVLIPWLLEEGYSFVSVSELLSLRQKP